MKVIITIIIILALGYIFFAYSSKAPDNVERAMITDTSATSTSDKSGTTDTASATTTDSTGATTGTGMNATVNLNVGASANISSKYKVQDFTFKFTGYGPGGKQETGTFKNMTVSDVTADAKGNPISGKLTIDTASVTTGKAGLDKHLCSPDFFDCAKYPTITFTFKKIAMTNGPKATVTGALSYNGVTKDVSFDVSINKFTAVADFLLDTTPFKFKYTGVNKDVRIQFGFNVMEVK